MEEERSTTGPVQPAGPSDRTSSTRYSQLPDEFQIISAEDAAKPGYIRDLEVLPTKKWIPEQQREQSRVYIAMALLGILAFMVVASFVSVVAKWATLEEIKGLLVLLFAPVVGLLGAATGFYFGEKHRCEEKEQ